MWLQYQFDTGTNDPKQNVCMLDPIAFRSACLAVQSVSKTGDPVRPPTETMHNQLQLRIHQTLPNSTLFVRDGSIRDIFNVPKKVSQCNVVATYGTFCQHYFLLVMTNPKSHFKPKHERNSPVRLRRVWFTFYRNFVFAVCVGIMHDLSLCYLPLCHTCMQESSQTCSHTYASGLFYYDTLPHICRHVVPLAADVFLAAIEEVCFFLVLCVSFAICIIFLLHHFS